MFFSQAEEEALRWGTRVKIASGIAQGVAFIHSIKNSPLNQEFRLHNILLDEVITFYIFLHLVFVYDLKRVILKV